MKQLDEVKKDMKTRKKRADLLKLELTDKQYSNLTLRSLQAGFRSAAELLQSFIADFTGWGGAHGNEERDLTALWYECAFWQITETVMPWRYFVYNFDLEISDLTEDPEKLEAAYRTYVEECRFANVNPETWENVQRINQELLDEEKAEMENLLAIKELLKKPEYKKEPSR